MYCSPKLTQRKLPLTASQMSTAALLDQRRFFFPRHGGPGAKPALSRQSCSEASIGGERGKLDA